MSHASTIRREGPSVSILHDSPDARVVLFTFRPGQGVPLHRTPSAVTLRVIRGRGILTRLDDQRTVWEGTKVAIEPHEAYAVRADDRETMTVLATISPSPRAR
ncbi:MAG TPA: cupin domain-containing protein [Gemmatimonadaceae bacterium]|jgi:quercetin dioxygenase-like cupin family protein|nr:cupin domain-containing protein [Gemmatimonadaceae bacterium]